MCAADQIIDTVDDGLADADVKAGQLFGKVGGQPVDERLLAFAPRPGVIGLEADRGLDVGHGPGVGAVVVAADLSDHERDLRIFQDGPAQLARHVAGLVQGEAGGHLHLQPKGALVEVR